MDFKGLPYHEKCCPQLDPSGAECFTCHVPIEGPVTMAANRAYHSQCFKCAKCLQVIIDAFDMVDNALFHPQCVPSGAVPPCEKCKRPCDQRSLLLDGKFYHEECLKCATCFQPLNTKYVESEGKMYHFPECAPASAGGAQACGKCGNELSNPACDVDGVMMHNACFKCDNPACRKPFESSYVKVGEGQNPRYYHEQCVLK